jgi:hypothetical protein
MQICLVSHNKTPVTDASYGSKSESMELSDDEDSDSIAPVQIMEKPLELLQTTAKLGLTSGNNVEEDDYSYSYANNSIGLDANGQNQDDPAAIPRNFIEG